MKVIYWIACIVPLLVALKVVVDLLSHPNLILPGMALAIPMLFLTISEKPKDGTNDDPL